MAKDFLASQLRTNQIIASRSLGVQPSLLVISASNAGGTGTVTPGIPAGSDAFVFISGSRGTDAFVVLGGSAKISGSLSVFDDVNLGQTTADTISFLGRVGTGIFPTTDKSYQLGQSSLQWSRVYSQTGSFDFISSSDNGIFFKGLSGSLQRTATGIPYLNSGTGITISTASNGQITIASLGVAGGIDKQVQFNDAGILAGDDGLTYNKTTKTLSVGNLFVTGSVTAVSTSNLTISDAVIYLASGSAGPNVRSVIAFASGSSSTDKSLIFGSLGANDTIVAARQDVSGGIIAQSNLSFTDLVPIRASKFEIGTSIALTSSDGLSTTFYSAGSGFISIVPGSVGLKLGNSSAPVAISGSNVRIGATSSEFSGEIPPLPGSDVYFFVSGSRGGKGTSGVSVLGGDAVISGSLTIGTGSITISSNEIKFLGGIAKIYSSSNGLVFEDSSGTKTLSSISTGGGGGGDSIFTAATSNSAFTTSSIAIGIASAANTRGADVFYYVSGTVGGLKKSLFEGDVISSGSFSVKDSSSGATKINLQNSGVISGSNELQIGGNLKLAGDIVADRNSARNVLTDVVDITIGGAASTVVIGGDIQINGNDIKSGGGATAITLNGSNISAPGNLEVTGSFSCNGNITLGDTTSDNIVFAGRVNSNLAPSADMARDLGSPTSRWRNIYTGDLHLRNDRGNWTIIEEEDFLTITNNLNGKKYKFVMEEI